MGKIRYATAQFITADSNFVTLIRGNGCYLRTTSRITPATIAATPAQIGMFTVCVSLIDNSIGPSLA